MPASAGMTAKSKPQGYFRGLASPYQFLYDRHRSYFPEFTSELFPRFPIVGAPEDLATHAVGHYPVADGRVVDNCPDRAV